MGAGSTVDRTIFSAIGALVAGLVVAGTLGLVLPWLGSEKAPVPVAHVEAPAPQTAPVPIAHPTLATPSLTGSVVTVNGTGSLVGTTGWISGTGTAIAVQGSPNATPVTQTPPEPAVRPVPSVQSFAFDESGLAEYRAVATEVGAVPAELTIADFRTFLADHKIPTFELAKVVGYMDRIAATDNPDHYGWHWAPVRASDVRDISLGRGSVGYSCNNCVISGNVIMTNQAWAGTQYSQRTAASDYYAGTKTVYARTIPLHALQLMAQIQHQFAGKVAFMISDYTTEPDRIVNPDPFLMAVIPNDKLANGEGRFIIDAWDEPGFGVGPKNSVTAP